jgi:ribosomal protein S18 acetylase RimI-like enzyme
MIMIITKMSIKEVSIDIADISTSTVNKIKSSIGDMKSRKKLYVSDVEYENKYLGNVKDLLVELEEYIVSIDKDHLDQVHPEYREKMAVLDLEDVNKNNGKCYLAVENNKAVGLIMGCIFPYDEYDYLDYKCPKRGEITELIVTNKIRSKGIGQELINKMEEYFKSVGCEYVIVDVFAYNDIGKNFYNKKDYHARMETMIKKI